jgi:hypothetical protein
MKVVVMAGVAIVSLATPACRSEPGGAVEGHALTPTNDVTYHSPVARGDSWAVQFLYLANQSSEDVKLLNVSLPPTPSTAGSVVVESIEVAPLPLSPDAAFGFAPGGVYKTYPPAIHLDDHHRCNIQKVAPLSGYVLGPGRRARVLVVMKAVKEGRYDFPLYEVTYEQQGNKYVQKFPVGLDGRIRSGPPLRMDDVEAECADQVRVLPSAPR